MLTATGRFLVRVGGGGYALAKSWAGIARALVCGVPPLVWRILCWLGRAICLVLGIALILWLGFTGGVRLSASKGGDLGSGPEFWASLVVDAAILMFRLAGNSSLVEWVTLRRSGRPPVVQ